MILIEFDSIYTCVPIILKAGKKGFIFQIDAFQSERHTGAKCILTFCMYRLDFSMLTAWKFGHNFFKSLNIFQTIQLQE